VHLFVGAVGFWSSHDWVFSTDLVCVPLFFLTIVSGNDSAGNTAGIINFYGKGSAGRYRNGDYGGRKLRR
jgi:hypothetical protein